MSELEKIVLCRNGACYLRERCHRWLTKAQDDNAKYGNWYPNKLGRCFGFFNIKNLYKLIKKEEITND
jgi:hypothetical protein